MNGTNRKMHGASVATLLAAAIALLAGQAALAAGTPEQKCEGGKNDSSGKYAACLAKAEKAYITTGDAAKYASSRFKCESKMFGGFGKLEAGAVAAGASCPTVGDQSAIEDFVEACNASIAAGAAGGAMGVDPVSCETDVGVCQADYGACIADLGVCDADLTTCEGDLADATADLADCEDLADECVASTISIPKTGQTSCYNDSGVSIACAGSLRDGDLQAGDSPYFVDNGDGTISDFVTGLMWEKLSDDGSIHDKDTQYVGLTAAIAKATSLNGMSFAGHNDWRIPNVRELGTLPVYGNYNPAVPAIFHTGCTGGCTVLTCSCTKNNVYFTTTVYHDYTPAVWKLNMIDGDVYAGNATDTHYARAVRTID